MDREPADQSQLAALRAQLAVYEETQEIAHLGSWRAGVGPDAVLELTSEARRILGFKQGAEIRNLNLFLVVHLEDREKLLEAILKVRTESVRSDVIVRIVRPDGEQRIVAIVAGPATGAVPSGTVLGTVQDVTDRHRGNVPGVDARFAAEADLRLALQDQQLFVEYQPIMSLEDGTIVGAEALVRWEHPARGRLEPDDFIGLAEDSGLIVPLGIWVFQRACQELRRWRDAGLRSDFTLSVNISAAQLWSEGFATELALAIDKAGVPWTSVVLEVTETILVEGVLEQTLRSVRERGAHIAIDDFGTKYSTLGYLPRLPIDALKIDSSFVHGIDDGAGRAVVTAIAALGRALNLRVTAEGVETAAQLAAVRDVGCDAVQGFLISPPLSGEACLDFVFTSPWADSLRDP